MQKILRLPEAQGSGPEVTLVTQTQFLADPQRHLGGGAPIGVRAAPADAVEDLAPHLAHIALVAIEYPGPGEGRGYTYARLLRQRYGFKGEIRAVGDVLREQAGFMLRCRFDTFAPADGSSPDEWTHVAHRFRHVYQRGEDGREPAFAERRAKVLS